MTEEVPSRLSPLHEFHLGARAKLADFGGWLMPIEYPGGVLAEHAAVREHVGIFDVSHLGKISVSGEGVIPFLNELLTNDLDSIESSQAQYTMLLDDSGGVIDDMIAYRVSDREVLLIPNASNSAAVFKEIASRVTPGISAIDLHRDFSVIAIQGPDSPRLLSAIGIELPTDLDYMSFIRITYKSQVITLCRTGYTGELGYEVVAPIGDGFSRDIWDSLVSALDRFNGKVVGLGARDTLRTEMGYALHGHELSRNINPLEAGVSWAVAMGKENFLGKESLLTVKKEGVKRKLVALLARDRSIPRSCMKVSLDGREVGYVTSGTFSPTLKKGIALALIDSETAKSLTSDATLTIDVRGRRGEFQAIKLPFAPSHVR
ncbi:MAG: glycine cleavage system aminomethyltransferase GcvT [Candidatus Nanopelagicaceae bacterium]